MLILNIFCIDYLHSHHFPSLPIPPHHSPSLPITPYPYPSLPTPPHPSPGLQRDHNTLVEAVMEEWKRLEARKVQEEVSALQREIKKMGRQELVTEEERSKVRRRMRRRRMIKKGRERGRNG